MSAPYAEVLHGTPLARPAPGQRHENICRRLHHCIQATMEHLAAARLLAPRAEVRVSPNTVLCPDLSLVTMAAGKLWLAAEIVSTDDHATDTVLKKQIYEEVRVPRLWMLDPRYDNIEVYHATEYGLVLKAILAGREQLTEQLLPGFQISVSELFSLS